MADRLAHQLRDTVFSAQRGAFPVARVTQDRANINFGVASARVALPAGSTLLRVTATQDCYLQFGDNTVVAANTDTIFIKGTELIFVPRISATDPNPRTHIAALRVTADGVLQVERLA